MTVFAILGCSLLALVAFVLWLAMKKPDQFRVQRSTHIKASPDTIFALINDFHNWGVWSPYLKLDPAMQHTFSGEASGVGAVYEWEGKGKAGAGRMEILASVSPSKVGIKLDFSKPFKAHNMAEFSIVVHGDECEVTWTIFGPAPLISKVMQVFVDCDKMIGKDFEEGLANMKRAAQQ